MRNKDATGRLSMSHKFFNRKFCGFTLIELLVVIAIIALLVSILLPSLQTAKELAKDATCKINQRGLVQSMHMYCNDYDGAFPNDGAERSSGNLWFVVGEDYFGERGILHCPSCENYLASLSWLPGEKYQLDIGMNYRLLDKDGYPLAAHNLSELTNPANTMLTGDCSSPYADRSDYYILHTADGVWGWNELDNRHSKNTRSNIGYTDGHVSAQPDDLLDLSASFDNWDFWCGTEAP